MARHDAYLDHLRRVPMFAACSKKELQEVAQLVTLLTIREGQTFIREGELAREMLIIEKGTAEVTHQGNRIAALGPGDVVGELALVLERHRNASVTATSDLEAFVIDSRSFATLLDDVPGFARKLLHTIAQRLSEQV